DGRIAIGSAGARRRAGLQVDGHAGGRIGEAEAGVALSDDGVVAPRPRELRESPQRTRLGAGAPEAGPTADVVAIGTADGFDGQKRLGADGGVARDDAGGEVNRDPGRGRRVLVIVDAVEAAPAVDRVVAGKANEHFDGAKRIVRAANRVSESGAPYG